MTRRAFELTVITVVLVEGVLHGGAKLWAVKARGEAPAGSLKARVAEVVTILA